MILSYLRKTSVFVFVLFYFIFIFWVGRPLFFVRLVGLHSIFILGSGIKFDGKDVYFVFLAWIGGL